MEVARIQPQKPPLQMLFRVTFVSVMFLLVVAIWAIYNYCQDEGVTMGVMNLALAPTYAAYDANRAMQPITNIYLVDKTAAGTSCLAGYEKSPTWIWPGNVAGYMTNTGTYVAGTVPSTVTG